MSFSNAETWDVSAQQYDAYEKKHHFYATVAEALLRQIPIREDSSVLELACGTGACTLRVAQEVPRGNIVALDFESMLTVARANIEEAGLSARVTFLHGDAREAASLLGGGWTATFDFAVCNSAFWHFPEPERVVRALELLLVEGGEFAFSVPTWMTGSTEQRDAVRAKVSEILLKHGVTESRLAEIRARRETEDRRFDAARLFSRSGFELKNETPFEFDVSRESRADWRKISAFSERQRWQPVFAGVDPAVLDAVSEELERWRNTRPRTDHETSRWHLYVARRRRGGGREDTGREHQPVRQTSRGQREG